jgi:hypothetical protein
MTRSDGENPLNDFWNRPNVSASFSLGFQPSPSIPITDKIDFPAPPDAWLEENNAFSDDKIGDQGHIYRTVIPVTLRK